MNSKRFAPLTAEMTTDECSEHGDSATEDAVPQLYLPSRQNFDENPELFQLDYNGLPKQGKKYWRQRYDLFSRFDEGVYMNAELWYSVTPEAVAIFIAKFLTACDPKMTTILDVFCGGGGNAVQLARYFDKVYGVDLNEEHLYCTEKNAELYDVRDKVELKMGSWPEGIDEEYMNKLQREVDFVFASPPWGGPGYKNKDCFDLTLLQPIPLRDLLVSFFKISSNVCLFLPKNSDLTQLSQVTKDLCGDDAKCRIIYVYNGGFIKGIYAIWGEKFMPPEKEENAVGGPNMMFVDQMAYNDYDNDFTNEYSKEEPYTESQKLSYECGEYDRGYQHGCKDGYEAGYQAALQAFQNGGQHTNYGNDSEQQPTTEKLSQHYEMIGSGPVSVQAEPAQLEDDPKVVRGIFGDRYTKEFGNFVNYDADLDY